MATRSEKRRLTFDGFHFGKKNSLGAEGRFHEQGEGEGLLRQHSPEGYMTGKKS